MPVVNRTNNGSGCPYCANQRVNQRNCLATINPELTEEWHPSKNGDLTPREVVATSNKKVWWRCKKGHEWQATVRTRHNGYGCKKCLGLKPTNERNLEVNYPDVARQWHPTLNGELKPSDFTPHSKRKVWWVCDRGHKWQAVIHQRTSSGQNCPVCSPNTSKIEIRLFCELKKIFIDTQWREKNQQNRM